MEYQADLELEAEELAEELADAKQLLEALEAQEEAALEVIQGFSGAQEVRLAFECRHRARGGSGCTLPGDRVERGGHPAGHPRDE